MPEEPVAQKAARKKRGWFLFRAFVFVVSVAFALPYVPVARLSLILPGLSPFLAVFGAIARRSVSVVLCLALPILVLSFFKGRWFCIRFCPMGFVTEQVGKLNLKNRSLYVGWVRIGRWIALLGLGGALAGYPFFLWLDPLSLFHGFFTSWRLPVTWISILPAVGFVLVMVLSFVRPHAWCERLCPLGAIQEMIRHIGRRLGRKKDAVPPARSDPVYARRTFLGMLIGGGSALALRQVLGREQRLPIRPPGAVLEDQMTALCARCGNCVAACPSNIIRPDLGQSGLAGLLTPVIDQSESYCYEWCHECTQVCPTGAIQHMDLETKRQTSVGLADITKSDCIAWEDGDYCMVCQEFCPYLAIDSVMHNGVNCPVVNADVCRGCGICHNQCPAQPKKAINIHGLRQKRIVTVA